MKSQVLLNSVTATGAGPIITLPRRIFANSLTSQIDMTLDTGVGTVAIEGRISPSATWTPLFTAVTVDDIQAVPWVRQIRANVTAYTSGNISAHVGWD